MGFPIRPIGPLIPLHHPMTVALLNTDMTPPLSKIKLTKKSESCIFLFCMGIQWLKIDKKNRSKKIPVNDHTQNGRLDFFRLFLADKGKSTSVL